MSRAVNSHPPEIQIAPLTPARWSDLEIVFGDGRGACGQCWCMYWRMPRRDFEASIGASTRQLFRARVAAGPPPGLLAYRDGAPVGWVQVGPRADVPGWNGARRLTAPTAEAPADDPQVWGISCFVTKAGCRRQGIATALLTGGRRLGPPKPRTGARRLPGRRQRQPPARLALSRARVDVPPSRLSGSGTTSPRSAADAPRAQRLEGEGLKLGSVAWSPSWR
jgi:Acetyltransferase (GNAT) family